MAKRKRTSTRWRDRTPEERRNWNIYRLRGILATLDEIDKEPTTTERDKQHIELARYSVALLLKEKREREHDTTATAGAGLADASHA